MAYKNIVLLLLFLSCFLCIELFSQTLNYQPNQLLIKWKSTSTPSQKNNLRTAATAKTLKSFPNLQIELWTLEDDNLTILELVDKYDNHPAIDFVEPNYIYRASEVIPSDPRFGDQWGMKNVGQVGGAANADISMTSAWDIKRESPNVKIAIIDTGIDWKHPDLVENIWQNLAEDADGDGHVLEKINNQWVFDPGDENGIDDDGNGYIDDFVGWDFANDDNDPYDDHFHGTHVAGIVGARGNNGIGVTGVTWSVQMAALKFLNANSFGSTSAAIAAINYAVAMDMDISNNSWGGPSNSSALRAAIQNGLNQNHLVIAAAGNAGRDADARPEYPAAFTLANVISVANTDRNDELATTSNYGATSVDLGAPGDRILSCFPNDSYAILSGTSMAAPHVTGACALLLEKQPSITYDIIKNELLNAVDAVSALNGKTVSGGRLNVCKVLDGCGSGVVSCAERDSLALVDLYNSTNGANWTIKWDLNQPMNTWSGVSTNANGCVVTFILGNNQLAGSIPPSIGNMTDLQLLLLHANQLTGNIPREITNLFNLRNLRLAGNQLTGPIPIGIGNMTNLREITLDFNQLSGEIPKEIGKLTKLERLYLASNQLTGTIPTEIGQLTRLFQLYLSNNGLTGSIPSAIGNLTRLEVLWLANNQLSGVIPTEIGQLHFIDRLDLSQNQLTGSIPVTLGNLLKVEDILLNNNNLTGCFSPNLASLCTANYNFSNNPSLPNNGDFNAFCIDGIGSCPCNRTSDSLALVNLYKATNGANWTTNWNLEAPINTWHGVGLNGENCVSTLNLSANNLTGLLPPSLAYLKALQTLNLQNNQLSGCFPQRMSALCTINYNFLGNAGLPNSGDFVNFCATNTGSCCDRVVDSLALVKLHASTNGNNWIQKWNLNTPIDTWYGITLNSDGCVKAINLRENQLVGTLPPELGNLGSLQEINIYKNQLTGIIPAELGNLGNLQELEFTDNQFTGIIPPELGFLTNLQKLRLSSNSLSGTIPPELGNLINLQELFLSSNQLTGTIPPELGNLINLERLYLGLNQLTGTIPPELGNLARLTFLLLTDNQLTGNIPTDIGNLLNLQWLTLDRNQLTGSIPATIGNLDQAERISASSNQLSGCFPPNFTKFCTTIFYSFSNNPDLPGGGDFLTFCENGTGSCADLTLVWPGDFNNDGVTNNNDVLYWGLARGNQGPVRPNASPNWAAQDCPDWTKEINNINGKHQDGDGNGQINAQDLSIIYANYGQVHATTLAAASLTNGITYRLEPQGYQGNTTFAYDLYVELEDAPIMAHGLAFRINLNDLPVSNATLDITNSSLNPDQNLSVYNAATKIFDVALTRTDKIDQLCEGKIATLLLTMNSIGIGDPIYLEIEHGNRVTADGTANVIASTSLYDIYTEVTASSSNLLPIVYTTHEECDQLGTARVEIQGGTPPYAIAWSNGATTAEITNLPAGDYTLSVRDANNLVVNYTINIKKQYLPVYDENGNLLNCDPTNRCATTLSLNQSIVPGIHQAGTTLISNGTVQAGTTVTYKAGESITLQANFTVEAGADFHAKIEQNNCSNALDTCELLVSPTIELTDIEHYEAGGNEWSRYRIPVTNWETVPDKLFDAAPNLPPCGLNTNASRTWISIYNATNDNYIYGFCSLGSNSSLQNIWFASPRNDCPPTSVYITLRDRACDKIYTSNTIRINCADTACERTTFVKSSLESNYNAPEDTYAIDLDKDGDQDILAAARLANKILWLKNNGDGNFTKQYIDFSGANAVFATDIDGDNDIDIVGGSWYNNEVAWWENTGNNSFTKKIVAQNFNGVRSVHAADIDGDNDIDIIAAAGLGNDLSIWRNNGSESFTKITVDNVTEDPQYINIVDFDKDGDFDILSSSNSAKSISWYQNNGALSFTKKIIASGQRFMEISIADIENDGDLDVLSASYTEGQINLWLNNGNQSFVNRLIKNDYSFAIGASISDLDDDGDLDLVTTAYGGDQVTWWKNTNSVFSEQNIDVLLDANTILPVDVNGDNRIDIISSSLINDELVLYTNTCADNVSTFINSSNRQPSFSGHSEVPLENPIQCKIVPNPTNQLTTLFLENAIGTTVSITLRNIRGQIVTTIANRLTVDDRIQSFEFDSDPFSPGIYYINIQSRYIQINEKLVIVK